VDALLLVSLDVSDTEVAVLHELGLPLAWVGEPVAGVHGELVDDAEAARLAVRHLVDLGHRRIAGIGGPIDGPRASGPAVRRTAGYRAVLADAGLEARPEWFRDGEFTPDGARHAVLELFTADAEPPTALFCQCDEMAFGALGALRALGLRCPEDVSVVGIDGHELAATFDLTTVVQPVQDLGAHAARWLVGSLAASPDDEDDDDDDDHDVDPEDVDDADEEPRVHAVRLDVRGSTAPPGGRAQVIRSVASSG
jgi:DNA-binding LacI/PurR family transcriptional regulator